jgi:hypothetical protein
MGRWLTSLLREHISWNPTLRTSDCELYEMSIQVSAWPMATFSSRRRRITSLLQAFFKSLHLVTYCIRGVKAILFSLLVSRHLQPSTTMRTAPQALRSKSTDQFRLHSYLRKSLFQFQRQSKALSCYQQRHTMAAFHDSKRGALPYTPVAHRISKQSA